MDYLVNIGLATLRQSFQRCASASDLLYGMTDGNRDLPDFL